MLSSLSPLHRFVAESVWRTPSARRVLHTRVRCCVALGYNARSLTAAKPQAASRPVYHTVVISALLTLLFGPLLWRQRFLHQSAEAFNWPLTSRLPSAHLRESVEFGDLVGQYIVH